MVIWITGLSGAGKTTLSNELEKKLRPSLRHLVTVDGDIVRDLFGGDLSHRVEDRIVQINRLQKLAKLLSTQGLVVIVAALYAHPDLLKWNRDNIDEYFEIYLDAPLPLVMERDAKGLYAAARSGEMQDVVGMDIPWNPPDAADITIDCSLGESPTAMAGRVIEAIPELRLALEGLPR